VGDAPKGSRTIQLNDVSSIVSRPHRTQQLTTYQAAEVLITRVDAATKTCTLSAPLPVNLANSAPVALATLKYQPLYPVGTPQFDETAAAWTRYALLLCKIVKESGITGYDLEIWNELTFGSKFLSINNYYTPPSQPFQ